MAIWIKNHHRQVSPLVKRPVFTGPHCDPQKGADLMGRAFPLVDKDLVMASELKAAGHKIGRFLAWQIEAGPGEAHGEVLIDGQKVMATKKGS